MPLVCRISEDYQQPGSTLDVSFIAKAYVDGLQNNLCADVSGTGYLPFLTFSPDANEEHLLRPHILQHPLANDLFYTSHFAADRTACIGRGSTHIIIT